MPNINSLKIRKVQFQFGPEIQRHWNNQNPVMTHFLNAFSSILPAFEHFFIQTLTQNKDSILDEALKNQVRDFCKQEGNHSAVHRKYNLMLREQGYVGLDTFERILSGLLATLHRILPARYLLAGVAAGEHITAFMGIEFLRHPQIWANHADPTMQGVWHWHAIEEVEHRAVCFNVYKGVSSSLWLRRLALPAISLPSLTFIMAILFYMLSQDRLLLRSYVWRDLYDLLFGKVGYLKKLAREHFVYWQAEFHPDNLTVDWV